MFVDILPKGFRHSSDANLYPDYVFILLEKGLEEDAAWP